MQNFLGKPKRKPSRRLWTPWNAFRPNENFNAHCLYEINTSTIPTFQVVKSLEFTFFANKPLAKIFALAIKGTKINVQVELCTQQSVACAWVRKPLLYLALQHACGVQKVTLDRLAWLAQFFSSRPHLGFSEVPTFSEVPAKFSVKLSR